jgi:hypothetical protein
MSTSKGTVTLMSQLRDVLVDEVAGADEVGAELDAEEGNREDVLAVLPEFGQVVVEQ